MPEFKKVLDFLEARAIESRSSSPIGMRYLITLMTQEEQDTLNFEEWDVSKRLLILGVRNNTKSSHSSKLSVSCSS